MAFRRSNTIVFCEEYKDDCGFTFQIYRKNRREKYHPKTLYCPICDREKVFIKQ